MPIAIKLSVQESYGLTAHLSASTALVIDFQTTRLRYWHQGQLCTAQKLAAIATLPSPNLQEKTQLTGNEQHTHYSFKPRTTTMV